MYSKAEIEQKLFSKQHNIVIDGIMEMVFNIEDVNWISNHLLKLSNDKNLEISRLAIISFGHLARMHKNIGDFDKVSKLLKEKKESSILELQGAADDAMDDIEVFMKINLR